MQAQKADAIASLLGLQRVGMIFNQSTSEKDYIVNNEEVYQMCDISSQVGEHCVIAVFSMLEEDGHVRFSWSRTTPALQLLLNVCCRSQKQHERHPAERGSFRGIPVLKPSRSTMEGRMVPGTGPRNQRSLKDEESE
jgi:hypothetical protein